MPVDRDSVGHTREGRERAGNTRSDKKRMKEHENKEAKKGTHRSLKTLGATTMGTTLETRTPSLSRHSSLRGLLVMSWIDSTPRSRRMEGTMS